MLNKWHDGSKFLNREIRLVELPFIEEGQGTTTEACCCFLFVLLVRQCEINSSVLHRLSLKCLPDIQVERSSWHHMSEIRGKSEIENKFGSW